MIGSYGNVTKIDMGGKTTRVYENGLDYEPIFAMAETERNDLWIGTYSGLFRFDAKKESFQSADSGVDLSRQPVIGLRSGFDGNLWILFADARTDPRWIGTNAWLASFKDGHWLRTPKTNQPDFNFDVRSIFLEADRSGNLWLPSDGGGLNRFSSNEFTFHPFRNPLEKDWALCVQEDRQGNLWVGTESGGLARWTPRKIVNYAATDGLANDNTWTLCEGRDGSVWVGTDDGVSQIKDGKITNLSVKDGLPRKEVRSVVEDRDGTLWVGTMNGLCAIQDGKITQHRFPGDWFETKIRVLLPAADGALWVGTVAGLSRLHQGQLTKYTPTNGLAHVDVRALLEDRAGNLWIGTAGGGVQRFGVPPSGGSAKHTGNASTDANRLKPGLRTFTTFATTNGLSSNNAWAFHEDADGVLWIGTDNGLNRLQDGGIKTITTREGLPAAGINCILEDDFGRLWISHDKGLYWVLKKELNEVAAGRTSTVRCVSYDESDGLLSVDDIDLPIGDYFSQTQHERGIYRQTPL